MSNQFKRILLSTVVIGSLGLTACDDQPPVDDYDKSACRAVSPDFDYTNLENLNMANFPTSNDVWSSLQDMVDFGPRHTASQADLNFLDYLEVRMEKMGLESITRDPVRVSGHNIMSHYSAPRSGLTYHLSGILPGMTDEVIVLGVHVDGQNSIEENGVIILLEIAEYLATVPKECRRHTFALVFANGHMASTDSSEAGGWASNHPDIMDRAVGFVSPEHVGFLYSPGNPIPFQFMATHGNLQTSLSQTASRAWMSLILAKTTRKRTSNRSKQRLTKMRASNP